MFFKLFAVLLLSLKCTLNSNTKFKVIYPKIHTAHELWIWIARFMSCMNMNLESHESTWIWIVRAMNSYENESEIAMNPWIWIYDRNFGLFIWVIQLMIRFIWRMTNMNFKPWNFYKAKKVQKIFLMGLKFWWSWETGKKNQNHNR